MIIVVLPAYNEEAALGPLLTNLDATFAEADLDYRVVVVNDGSADGTATVVEAFAQHMPVQLVNHPVNRGLSEALKTGFLTALDLAGPRDAVVTMDADNTHAPGLILRMVRLISEGHDVVIASRYVEGARIRGLSNCVSAADSLPPISAIWRSSAGTAAPGSAMSPTAIRSRVFSGSVSAAGCRRSRR